MSLSFEIYATNTVETDNQKRKYLLVDDKPRDVMKEIKIFDDLKFIAIYYIDPTINKRLSKINVTFIENELSEAIMAMLQIRYPQSSQNGVFDYVYFGGATLRDINQPTTPMLRPSIGEYNIISDAIIKGFLDEHEKEELYKYALKLRIKLRNALTDFKKSN